MITFSDDFHVAFPSVQNEKPGGALPVLVSFLPGVGVQSMDRHHCQWFPTPPGATHNVQPTMLVTSPYTLPKAAAKQVVPSLRGHLAGFLSGTASSNLRQRMFEEIISGTFPSPRYRNSVEGSYQGEPVNFGLYESFHRVHEDVTRHSARCARLCCTGVFIVEAMLKVNVLCFCPAFYCL